MSIAFTGGVCLEELDAATVSCYVSALQQVLLMRLDRGLWTKLAALGSWPSPSITISLDYKDIIRTSSKDPQAWQQQRRKVVELLHRSGSKEVAINLVNNPQKHVMALISTNVRLRTRFAVLALLSTLLVIASIGLLKAGPDVQQFRSAWLPVAQPHDNATPWTLPLDEHPIGNLMKQAADQFIQDAAYRSKTFKQAVAKYRARYGRHPPPGYREWYKFARMRKVYDIDDFDQINGDLRPFWAVKPSVIRNQAAHLVDKPDYGTSILAVRNGHVYLPSEYWRPETFIHLLEVFASNLPDMDIILNNLDQPRVVVPWDDLQAMLKTEESSRSVRTDGVQDHFTKGMSNYWVPSEAVPDPSWAHWIGADRIYNELKVPEAGVEPAPEYEWVSYSGKPYLEVCAKGCPPESYARNTTSEELRLQAERRYKHKLGGFITNFNISSDICTVGPQIADLHGFMFASTSLLSTSKLVPIFSECKVNVNNDILYPANMYYKKDKRYEYSSKADVNWEKKKDQALWRGVTSGGTARVEEPNKWKKMHRHRLVFLTNSTLLQGQNRSIVALEKEDHYAVQDFHPASFAEQYTDVGFTEKRDCIPNCDFYDSTFHMMEGKEFSETFRSKYLIDVDGMSFSGRWRAYLQSRSLGLKATIFREWHDSRLLAWKHFVPMDNRYDDFYSLLAYFIGIEQSTEGQAVRVPQHDREASVIAENGREWAMKVLRQEDIEIYTYRLLLEYGRVIDDNRDFIGVADDGGKEMEDFDKRYPAVL